MNAETINVLRAHIVDDRVWYGDDATPCLNSGLTVDEFLNPDESGVDVRLARLVRVLGTGRNAALICGMYDRKPIVRREIRLGSPALCQTQAVLSDPAKVLRYLWQPDTPSDLVQHWHLCDGFDYLTYSLIREAAFNEAALTRAERHPAWPALSFVQGYDRIAAVRLLVDIVDPRWFVHYWRPHRLSRLYEYLGLTPQNILAALGRGGEGRNYERAVNVIKVWRNKPRTLDLEAPEAFLWRIASHYTDPVKGVLRACKTLVNLVTHVWLDGIRRSQPQTGFSPSTFFYRGDEYAAFERHREKFV